MTSDLVDMINDYVALHRAEGNFVSLAEFIGLCPFHSETKPSFSVNPARGFYHCFGCGAHGSRETFLTEIAARQTPTAVQEADIARMLDAALKGCAT